MLPKAHRAFPHTQAVVQSRGLKRYTLFVNNEGTEVVAMSMAYYAVPAGGRRFSVVDCDETSFAATWTKLIRDAFKLEIRNGIQWQRLQGDVKYVSTPAVVTMPQPAPVHVNNDPVFNSDLFNV
jgi:cellobiose phosphorylase